ncbi:MAG: epoxyqueuosine reductase [Chloroflexi bacterium]|nr:epoxyqueuosine reductase [Chloroflexota bacterium]
MAISQQAKERVLTEPEQFIKQAIKTFAGTSPANRLSFIEDYTIFDEPLVRFADGDDPIFAEYKTIIAPTHLTPREALAKAYNQSPEALPARISVISWILPITEKARKSNRSQTLTPGRLWSHTRWYGEQFNDALREHVVELLTGMGYLAVAPASQPYFKTERNEKGPYSNWSERHIAYAAGHGTFSLSDGFITESGIAHRCGSVVTDLTLTASPRTAATPYSNCLFYVDGSCSACIIRCPAGAITEQGHDKLKCQAYLRSIGYSPAVLKDGYDNDVSVAGCGLCQTKVPCEYRIPAKIGKRKRE